MQAVDMSDWAKAIAIRISDEWSWRQDFPEDAGLLCEVIAKLLEENPQECSKLIGTGIIEEDYFEPLV